MGAILGRVLRVEEVAKEFVELLHLCLSIHGDAVTTAHYVLEYRVGFIYPRRVVLKQPDVHRAGHENDNRRHRKRVQIQGDEGF
jgi:hypothetical protein